MPAGNTRKRPVTTGTISVLLSLVLIAALAAPAGAASDPFSLGNFWNLFSRGSLCNPGYQVYLTSAGQCCPEGYTYFYSGDCHKCAEGSFLYGTSAGYCCPAGYPNYYDGECHQCGQGYFQYGTSAGNCCPAGYPYYYAGGCWDQPANGGDDRRWGRNGPADDLLCRLQRMPGILRDLFVPRAVLRDMQWVLPAMLCIELREDPG